MIVRPAVAKDNTKLIDIEKLTPQGEQIKLVSERKDYFFRAKKFENPIFLVAEDEAQGDILGIMGVGPVTIRLQGETIRGGLIFDWRSNPLTQKGLPRHMLRLWQAAQTEIANQNLKFIFGYVKEDNVRSMTILQKYGAQDVEQKVFLTMPVHASFCKDRNGVNQVDLARTIDLELERRILEDHFGSLDLFSEPTEATFPTREREQYMFGKFTYGKSALKVWDTNAEYSQRVLNIPLLYKVARPVFKAASRVVALPRIPRLGDEIKVWQLYDLILDQPDDLSYLLERVRLAAIENGIDYLVICMNEKDAGFEQIAKKAWVRLKYHLFFVPMEELPLPQGPTYFDVSYL
ncbi:MAG TPA: hypothetical protein VJZ70_01265 [Limnochordia bacterium]|nr:hypothetical protein [Limnochordia bacterium]